MKAFTDISQSKKLAEFLPLESADVVYVHTIDLEIGYERYNIDFRNNQPLFDDDVCAWSLAALLEQLDDEMTDENGNDYHLRIVKESLQYQLYYHDSWGQVEDIETDYYDDLVDACYEMIIILHEQKLL